MNYPQGALSWILIITHPLLATCFQLMLLLTHPPGIISTVSSTCSMTPLKHYKASLLQYFIGTLITLSYSIPLCVMYFSLTVGTCCSHCTYCFSYLIKVMSVYSVPNTQPFAPRGASPWLLQEKVSIMVLITRHISDHSHSSPSQTFLFYILPLTFLCGTPFHL